MSDNDTTKVDAIPSYRGDSSAAFRQAMTGVATRCNELRAAIDRHDFEDVAHLAQNAVEMWLAGRVACRRLIQRTKETSLHADAARRFLEANYIALLELFAHATKTIAVPRMRKALSDLRTTLTTMMAQPLSDEVIAKT